MRLSLSKYEVNLLLEGIELKRRAIVNPSQKLVNRLLSLKDKLLWFRKQVWDTEYKEV